MSTSKRARVTCINKPNRFSSADAILNLGEPGIWKLTLNEVLQHMDHGWEFYADFGGFTAWIVPKQRGYTRYVQTRPDGHPENNLLYLPECP